VKQSEDTKIIHDITFKRRKRMKLFDELSNEKKLMVFQKTSKKVARDIVHQLRIDELVRLLEKMDPDDATDILRLLSDKKRALVIKDLNETLKTAAVQLLQFDPRTAAGVMKVDYIQVDIDDRIESVVEKFRIHEKRTGRIPTVLVLSNGKLSGTLSIADLLLGRPSDKISAYLKSVRTIHHGVDHKDVVKLFNAHPHDKIVVVNSDKTVLGIIYSDDALELMNEMSSSSLYDFAGINDEETVLGSARSKVRFRVRWLIVNLFTAFLAAFAVSLFDETISKYVLLAVYMPIVAGMGGNAATQTLAVVVRGISLKQIDLRTGMRTLKNEVVAGAINGFINAVIVAIIVIVLSRDVKVAFVLSIAMVINLIVAGFFGTITPLIMSRLGKDPASSATVFITTATDVLGFVTFLGLGSWILG